MAKLKDVKSETMNTSDRNIPQEKSNYVVETEGNEDLQPLPLLHPCNQQEFNAAYRFKTKTSTTLMNTITNQYDKCNVTAAVLSLFPIIEWLPGYCFKANLGFDIVAGLTVAVMHIPQGMAYASLGGVNPIVGIYMAVFPVFVYSLMGTSRHISQGTFAVVCLMAAAPVFMLSSTEPGCSALQAASVISLTVGLLQLALGLCRAGSLAVFLSPALVSGFTTGASVLVLVSQLQHVVGVKLPKHFGLFNIVYTLNDFVKCLPATNYLTVALTFSVVLFLTLYSDYLRKKLIFNCVFPIEMIVIIVGTAMSHTFNFEMKHGITVLGSIPTGFPSQDVPLLYLAPKVFLPSLVIAIVSFTVNISMATIFATKDDYKINPTQELVATGCANVVGAFFSCLPISASLSRSMIQYTAGGKSQLVGIFSCVFLLSVVLYFGKFLEPLPYCVLAGIIIKSLRVMLLQVMDLPAIWKQSVTDGIIWLSTFLTVVLVNVEVGLCIAVILSLLSIVFVSQKTSLCLLGHIPETDIYLELNSYLAAKQIPGFILIQVHGGLNFANIGQTKDKIKSIMNARVLPERGSEQQVTLVIDLSAVPFVDQSALHSLNSIISDMEKRQITVCLAYCSTFLYRQMKKCDFFNEFPEQSVFPTVHDAVMYHKVKRA